MSQDDFKQYDEFIETYDKLFHLSSAESDQEILNLITTVLISKYRMNISHLIRSLSIATVYNYRAFHLYVKILNQIFSKFSISQTNYKKEDYEFTHMLPFELTVNDDNIYQVKNSFNFPEENTIDYIIMHDQIDKFREFVIENSLKNIIIYIPGENGRNLIEACCYYGSVNIFNFLKSNLKMRITYDCLPYSFAGGNTDIINECLENYKIDIKCFQYIVGSHNNKFLEFIFERDLFEERFLYHDTIIKSQNMKAVILLYKKDIKLIMPWCAAFPQTLDFLKNEVFAKTNTNQFRPESFLRYAVEYNNKEICELVLGLSKNFEYLNDNYEYRMTALHIAARYNYKEIIDMLLLHGANVNARCDDWKTPLHYATLWNCQEIVEVLLSHGADINAKDLMGRTALHCAIVENNIDIVKKLIAHCALIDAVDKKGRDPLSYAAARNNSILLEYLLTHGTDSNTKDFRGYTALHIAVKHKSRQAAEILISNGTNINEKDKKKRTALHIAIKKNNKEFAEFLISNGAKIGTKDQDGQTALDYAASENSEIVDLLLSHCTKNNRLCIDWLPAFHKAVKSKCVSSIMCFISHGVNINLKNYLNNGRTALHIAVQSKKSSEIVEILLSHGADVNLKDKYGNSALHIAADNMSFIKNSELLISHGIDINAKNFDNKTALHFSSMHEQCNELTELLISHGLDVNFKDKYGKSPLHYAVENNEGDKTIKILIKNGADINIKDANEQTPLHIAAIMHKRKLLETLVANGADVDIKDNHGKTALHYNVEKKYEDIAKFLISNDADVNAKDSEYNIPLHISCEKANRYNLSRLLVSNGLISIRKILMVEHHFI